MLVLTRREDESIMIGDVEVMVVKIQGYTVRLGVIADKAVAVDRKEVREKKTRGEP